MCIWIVVYVPTQQYMIVGFAQKRKADELENFQYIQDGIILEIE